VSDPARSHASNEHKKFQIMSDDHAAKKSFAALYQVTVAPLRRYLARMLKDPAEAQDVSHEAYLRVYPLIKEQKALKPEALLYTTARRLALNRIKRRQIAPFVGDTARPDIAPSPAPGVVQQVMARQDLARLKTAIAALPPGCRAVLLLRKIELLSHQEIAGQLGLSVSTVEKHHARALRLLRAALVDESGQSASDSPEPEGKEIRS
jgi:RNA polymerase sigma-70 factor (ECF subfamily)